MPGPFPCKAWAAGRPAPNRTNSSTTISPSTTFPDGTRLAAQGRHINNTYAFFGDVIQGTTGSAVLGEGIPSPRIFKGHHATPGQLTWQYRGEPKDAYQIEHDLWFHAIRNNLPYNETERCTKSCLAAIMGRMACESGKMITLEEAQNSNIELSPGLASLKSLDDPAPVMPDAQGAYPIAMPGTTEVLQT